MRDVEKCLVAFFLGAVMVGLPIAAFYVMSRRAVEPSPAIVNAEEWEVVRNGNGRILKIIVHREVKEE